MISLIQNFRFLLISKFAMVLHFPSSLTEEEQMLQRKYAQLRKKKKQLAAIKSNTEEERKERANSELEMMKKKNKPIPEAKDAKEVAKKLIRSGAIAAIKKAVEKEAKAKAEKSTGFKRSQGLERKLTGLDARAGYQPFSATHGPGGGFDTGGEDMNPDPPEPPPAKKVKNLYESFVSARDREERGLTEKTKNSDRPRTGNTVHVFGYSITEDIIRGSFVPPPGCKIINVSMEVEKNTGFVTFDKAEAAEAAINQHNGSVVQGIELKVSLARRQPVIEPINDASSSATWSTIAASHSQKGSHKDKRDLVAYDQDDMF